MSIILLKLVAKMLPIEEHIERLQEELLIYKINPNGKKNNLMSSLMILITALQDEDKSLEDIVESAIDDDRKLNVMKNMFDPTLN